MDNYLSIICPVRNGGSVLLATLKSIAKLPCPIGANLIISDNFSTDGSAWEEALKLLPHWNPRVIHPPTPLGRVEHWSWAFTQSQAKWIKPIMAGDRIHEIFFEVLAHAESKNAALCVTRTEVCLPDKTVIYGFDGESQLLSYQQVLHTAKENQGFPGPLSALAIRADALAKALPFESAFPWSADLRLTLRVSVNATVWTSPCVGCTLDQRIARLSTSPRIIARSLVEEWQIMRWVDSELSIPYRQSITSCLRHTLLVGFAKYGRTVFPERFRKRLGALYEFAHRGTS